MITSCADLEICVNGVITLYVERSNLMSDGQARLQVECWLGRFTPLSMHHFRHDVIPLLHQVRTFHSPARALHSRVTTSAFFAAPEGRPDCHQDLAACHPLRTQAHIKHRARIEFLSSQPTRLRQVQALGLGLCDPIPLPALLRAELFRTPTSAANNWRLHHAQ